MNIRKNLAALTAAVTVMSAAVTVFATDYTVDPSYPLPPSNTTPPPSYTYNGPEPSHPVPVISGQSQPSAPAGSSSNPSASNADSSGKKEDKNSGINASSTLIDKIEATDLSSGKPISASYKSAEVKSTVLAELAKSAKGKLFVNTKRYDIIIDSRSVTDVKDINLGMQMSKNTKAGAMIIRTVQKGEYGCTVNMIISSKYYSQCKVNLNKAKVYYVDEGGSAHVMGKVILDDTGNIVLPMTFGGKYIIK